MKYGLSISGGALAASVAQSTASAKVPVALVWSTAHAATLVAAGQFVGVSVSAVRLMKGAMKTMFLAKLKTVIGTSVVAVALGLGGLIYNAELAPGGAQAADEAKPNSELERLRKENELLKMNLRVTLEKLIVQDEELKKLKGQAAVVTTDRLKIDDKTLERPSSDAFRDKIILPSKEVIYLDTKTADEAASILKEVLDRGNKSKSDLVAEVDAAIKAWKDAKDKVSREKALEEIQKVFGKIKAGEQKERGQ
jgi:hypothetical protein